MKQEKPKGEINWNKSTGHVNLENKTNTAHTYTKKPNNKSVTNSNPTKKPV